MKECKVIHIHSGEPLILECGRYRTAEEYTWSGDVLAMYRNTGWEVVQILPSVAPAQQKPGCWSFYKDGIIAILEREVREENQPVTQEMWQTCGEWFDQRLDLETLEADELDE